jgi:hypothetical protein
MQRKHDQLHFRFGESYTNGTGLNRETFFTGSKHVRVREIEVFAIAD